MTIPNTESAASTNGEQTAQRGGVIVEAQNLVKRYVVLGTEQSIVEALSESESAAEHSPFVPDGHLPLRLQTQRAVRVLERQIILRALNEHRWNRRHDRPFAR